MANPGEHNTDFSLTEDRLIIDLADGRSILVPLTCFPRLLHATFQQRNNLAIAGAGCGIHWPDIDKALSVESLFCGAPAPRRRRWSTNTAMHPSRRRKIIVVEQS
jgi:hypothetical protein